MTTTQEWQKAAEDLANVVSLMLAEHEDMLYGTAHKEAALAALEQFAALVDRPGVEPEGQPSRGEPRTDATGRDER